MYSSSWNVERASTLKNTWFKIALCKAVKLLGWKACSWFHYTLKWKQQAWHKICQPQLDKKKEWPQGYKGQQAAFTGFFFFLEKAPSGCLQHRPECWLAHSLEFAHVAVPSCVFVFQGWVYALLRKWTDLTVMKCNIANAPPFAVSSCCASGWLADLHFLALTYIPGALNLNKTRAGMQDWRPIDQGDTAKLPYQTTFDIALWFH